MAKAQINLDAVGGTSNVKTGTFSITSAGQEEQIDTGLGSAIKYVVFVQKSSSSSYTASPLGMVGWMREDASNYKTLTAGGSPQGYSIPIGTVYNAAPLAVMTNPSTNGTFTVKAGGTIDYAKGDYVWYAE